MLPIEVPGKSKIYILSCYPKRTNKIEAGFDDFINESNARIWWPGSPENRRESHKGELAYRYVISNHENVTLTKIEFSFKIQYKKDMNSREVVVEHERQIEISAIEPKSPFTFYVVNKSPNLVLITPSQNARIQIAGDPKIYNAPLNKAEHGVMDKLPMLFLPPAETKWIGIPE